MTLLALIIYTRVRVVRPFVCANCVRVYTIERAVRARIYMRMHLYPREFAFVYTQKRKCNFLRAYACVRACLRANLIKTQNAFAHNISTLKRTLGSETFRMYYIRATTRKFSSNPGIVAALVSILSKRNATMSLSSFELQKALKRTRRKALRELHA